MKNYTPLELLEMSLALHRMINDDILTTKKTKIQYLTGIYTGEIEPILVSDEDIQLASNIKNHFKKYLMMVLSNDEIDIKHSSKRDYIYLYKILYQDFLLTKTGKMHYRNISIISQAVDLYNCDMFVETLKLPNIIDGWLTPGLISIGTSPFLKNTYTMDCRVIYFKKCISYNGWNMYGIIDNYLVSWYSDEMIQLNINLTINFRIKDKTHNYIVGRMKETRISHVKIIDNEVA